MTSPLLTDFSRPSPWRDAFRPTTTLGGPGSAAALRPKQRVLLLVCWLVWYWAAGYALDVLNSHLVPPPNPRQIP